MTFSRKNFSKKKPEKFLKYKKATMLLSSAAIVILLGLGYRENSLIILILKIGLEAVLEAIQLFISDENA